MSDVVAIKPFKTSETPNVIVQTASDSKYFKGIVPQQLEQKAGVKKGLSQRNLWVWLLPNGVNCKWDSQGPHEMFKIIIFTTPLAAWTVRDTVQKCKEAFRSPKCYQLRKLCSCQFGPPFMEKEGWQWVEPRAQTPRWPPMFPTFWYTFR